MRCIFIDRIPQMYRQLLLSILLISGCAAKHTDYTKAENAFDAGREFIDAGYKGDFTKAAFFMLPDEKNQQLLKVLEKEYRTKDKEGRQQSRTASINIIQVSDIDDHTSIIQYSNSFDKIPQKIKVVKQGTTWLVDYKYSFEKN